MFVEQNHRRLLKPEAKYLCKTVIKAHVVQAKTDTNQV